MPRIRTVKPDFLKHWDLFRVEQITEKPIRIAYLGLWICADKEGRFKWQPQQLKLDILPYNDVSFEKILHLLCEFDFIKKYESDNKFYGIIPTFKEHQRITGSEAQNESKLPVPVKFLETPKQYDGIDLETLWKAYEFCMTTGIISTDCVDRNTLEIIEKHFGNILASRKGKERKGTDNIGKEIEPDFFQKKNEWLNEDFLVPKMIKIFIENFPKYPVEKEKDAIACGEISNKIAEIKKWKQNEVLNGKMNQCLDAWKEIVLFVKNDSWFCSRSIPDLNKEWQRLIQKINSKNGNNKKTFAGGENLSYDKP